MPASIDSLQIEITAQANKADAAIDRLVGKLDKLSNSLRKIPTGNISGLASGVDKLGKAMQLMGNIDSRSFTRLANNINKLSHVDSVSINNASASIRRMANSFNVIGTASQNTQNVAQLANALGKLGGKSVTNAVANIPLLTTAMDNLLRTLSRSPQVSRSVIDMTNALANLASQGRSIGTASRSVVNGLNNTHGSMASTRRSAHSLASAFGRLYANYFLIIRGAKAFINSIKGTADYLEAFNYYNVAFGKIADEWDKDWEKYGYDNAEAYANSFTERMNDSLSKMSGLEIVIDADGKGLLTSTNLKNLGLNIQDVTQYASQLASVTNSVGQTGEVSLAAAKSFTKLGADISSLFNIDYSDVMANLQSGLIGQSRALYKYGIDITNATLQTYAFELGLSKSVSEMTQAEKMQLRMVAILDQSRVAWGDLANTINSPSNMLRQFGNNVKEIGMVLGQLFIPVMQRVMPIINGVAIAIKDMLVSFAELLGVELDLDAFGQGFSGMEEDSEDLSEGLDDVADSANKALKSLGKFDELTNINSKVDPFSSSNLLESIDLTNEIIKRTEEYEKAWAAAFENMQSHAQGFANKIKEKLSGLKQVFEDFINGDYEKAGSGLSDLFIGIFEDATKGLKKVNWKKIGEKIGEFLKGIKWKEVFMAVGNFFVTLIQSAAELWVGSFEKAPLGTLIITGLAFAIRIGGKAQLVSAFSFALKKALGLVSAATIGWNAGQLLYELFTGEEIDKTFSEQMKDIKDSFSNGTWKGAFEEMGKDAGSFFGSGFSLIWDSFKAAIVNPFVSAFNDIWISINDVIITPFAELWDSTVGDIWRSIEDTIIYPIADFFGWLDETTMKYLNSGRWNGSGGHDLFGKVGTYATGGFPEDGLFMANHNELVGQFSNGRTAVANNYQIVEGIGYGVEKAVSRVLEPYLSQIAQNTRETADKEFGISEERVFRATQNQANAFQKRTGRLAFG